VKKNVPLYKISSFAVLVLYILFSFTPALAQEGGEIQVLETQIENNFPNGLTFKISLQSQNPITGIKLYFKSQGDLSTQSHPVEFETGSEVDVSYTWDTSNFTVAPSTPITYYWKVTDELGNSLITEEQLIYYDDIHFDWQEIRSDEIIIRWYEGDASFGKGIFDAANRALSQMKSETDRELDFPVIILLYANEEDFTSWQYYTHQWVGGLAFPSLGITAQIIPSSSPSFWIENVIPHEIAHLFFYQIINADIYFWPRWLDEGFAQYYEFTSNDAALERVIQAAHDRELLPLVLISGDFGNNPERAYLAYDQSYAVVVYMLETWGQEGLQKLVANFREGQGYREAIEGAYDLTYEEFEASWITWLGVPTTPAPPPTPTQPWIFKNTPQAMILQTSTPDAEEETGGDIFSSTQSITPDNESGAIPDQQGTAPTIIYIGGIILGLLLVIIVILIAVRNKSSN
jgi:hypothetical protein